jgi:hypothetical protein
MGRRRGARKARVGSCRSDFIEDAGAARPSHRCAATWLHWDPFRTGGRRGQKDEAICGGPKRGCIVVAAGFVQRAFFASFLSFSCSIFLGKRRERFEGDFKIYFKIVQILQNSQNSFITVVLSLN